MQTASSLGVAPAPPAWGARRAGERSLPFLRSECDAPRVLFLATSQNDGGIERYSVQMAAELRRRGVPVTYACLPSQVIDERCRAAGVPTHPFGLRNSGDLRAALRLADLIAAGDFQILHVHSRRDYVPALLGAALARRQGRPVRLVLHAHMLRALGQPARLNRHLFQGVGDAVIAVSSAVRERLLHDHGFGPEFVRLLSNGVDLDTFDLRDSPLALLNRQNSRRAWGLSPEALVVGMIGRLDAKGQAGLLAVAPPLVRRFPQLYIVLVGAEGAPGERQRLHDQAQEAGIAERLLFTGPRDDVPELLPAFDVLAHLPTDEAFGLAVVEAMAAGLPSVATDIGGCREVVRDGITGLLVPPEDSAALNAALSRLLSRPDLRRQMGRQGRQVAENEFALPRQMDRLLALYEDLCPTPRTA